MIIKNLAIMSKVLKYKYKTYLNSHKLQGFLKKDFHNFFINWFSYLFFKHHMFFKAILTQFFNI
jgi:hypothetical protein